MKSVKQLQKYTGGTPSAPPDSLTHSMKIRKSVKQQHLNTDGMGTPAPQMVTSALSQNENSGVLAA